VRGREQGEGYGEKEMEEKQGIEGGEYGEVWKMKEKEGKILSAYFYSPIKDKYSVTPSLSGKISVKPSSFHS
jgi:hypothetical protein